jgi:8-oxo-dGTP diphosphatase
MPANEQGVNFERYMLVPRTLIFLTRGGQILLLKGAPGKRLWAGLYNGIGGHVEQGEDVLTAAYRELKEETGLDSSNLLLCGVVTIDTQINPGVCVYVIKGEFASGQLIASREGSLEWVQMSELSCLQLVADLPVLLPRVMAYHPGDPPFSAHSHYSETGELTITFRD